MSNIRKFLLARIAEDEAAARAANPSPWAYTTVESVGGGALYDRTRVIGSLDYEQPGEHDGRIVRHLPEHEADANGAHIARHDPARVLAECEAKRQAITIFQNHPGADPDDDRRWNEYAGMNSMLLALALPYADHPDFDPVWKLA